ncbi:MAG: DNA primase [Hellea sp.]
MRFGENFMDEIKTRVRVSDVVGRHVKLKRQGREFAGLSPFTNEKTPSFFVNDEKGFYHCFSSGKHGDAISFFMEVEGLSFPEAVERLAEMAGVEMPKADPRAEERAARNKKTISWMEQAQVFFEKSLYRDVGSSARDYLKGRGLSKTAAENFGLGFAANHFSALKDELMQQGASPKMLIEAGLIIEPEDKGREPWDRFRDRIMFPIHDTRGRLVAFGGRAMEKGAKAKYLNSPETPIFQKGQLLYNYHRARKAISNPQNGARGMIVAEGYMDVIALSRAGFEHAVAPMGTALTEDQLELLWRSGPEPILCFDGDKAGQRAAFRSVERALPLVRPGQTLRFAMLPDGQDPDDLIKAKGRGAMEEVLNRAISLVDMLWEREVQAEPLNSPEAKAGLKSRIFAALKEIQHDDVRAQYQTALLHRFDAEFGRQKKQYSGGSWNNKTVNRKASPALKATMQSGAIEAAREKRLIGAILEWPELLSHVDEALFEMQFSSPQAVQMQRALLSYWRVTKTVEKSALNTHIASEGLETLHRDYARDRLLIRAAMGGTDAELDLRAALWMKEADSLNGQDQTGDGSDEARSLMADAIRNDNSDALKRRMRASKGDRE